MFALNQGEVCTCPSRALVHEDIADKFLELAVERVKKIKIGHPLDTETMMGAQASQEQMDKIKQYLEIGPQEGAETLVGGHVNKVEGLEKGYYIEPTVFKGNNDMRIFQEEIFGPVLSVATFKDYDEAIEIANATNFGLGAGVWSRSQNICYRAGRDIQAGRVWVTIRRLRICWSPIRTSRPACSKAVPLGLVRARHVAYATQEPWVLPIGAVIAREAIRTGKGSGAKGINGGIGAMDAAVRPRRNSDGVVGVGGRPDAAMQF